MARRLIRNKFITYALIRQAVESVSVCGESRRSFVKVVFNKTCKQRMRQYLFRNSCHKKRLVMKMQRL